MARDALAEELGRFGLAMNAWRIELLREGFGCGRCDSRYEARDKALPKGGDSIR